MSLLRDANTYSFLIHSSYAAQKKGNVDTIANFVFKYILQLTSLFAPYDVIKCEIRC